MIVVKIELHSARTGEVKELGRMLIANDGEGTDKRCNYDVKVLRRRERKLVALPAFRDWYKEPLTRTGRVEGFPRHSYNLWRLVLRALRSAFPEEG